MAATSKPAKIKKKINPDDFVNHTDGETLSSKFPTLTSLNTYSEDVLIIDYSKYTLNDYDSFMYLSKEFNRAERDRITEMGFMARTNYSILYNNDTNSCHTDATLMKAIDYTYSKYLDFMKKLKQFNIIVEIEDYRSYKNNQKSKYYIFNPFIARSIKAVHRDCANLFNKFKHETSKLS